MTTEPPDSSQASHAAWPGALGHGAPTRPGGAHGRLSGIAFVLGGLLGVIISGGVVALVVLLGNHRVPVPPARPPIAPPHASVRGTGTARSAGVYSCWACLEGSARADGLSSSARREKLLVAVLGAAAPHEGNGIGGFGGPSSQAYALGDGLAIDPAAGWRTASASRDQVVYIDSAQNSLFLAAGLPESGSPSTALVRDAVAFGKVVGASQLRVGALHQGRVTHARSGITEFADVPFSATLSNQQTTLPVSGLLFALIQQRASYQAFVAPFSTSLPAFRSEAAAMNTMIDSILNS